MKNQFQCFFFAISLFIVPDVLFALDAIPTEDGFSGYVAIGGGGIRGKSNLIAGNSIADIGNKTITSLNASPKSENDSIPIINAELAYTFAGARTQIYVGNKLEDFLEFDFTSLIGVRHELSDKSLLAASFVFSGLPAEVWEDPYLINQPRSKTDRESTGIRLEWDKIMGSKLGLEYTYREIDIDDEKSGQSLGLSSTELSLLEREGENHVFKMNYNFDFNNGHFLKPELKFVNQKLDGKAMRNDAWVIGLTHTYNTNQYALITTVDWAAVDYDKSNPIYNKTRDDDRWGIGLSAAYKQMFGLKNWNLLANIAYYDIDSNIDFYDASFKFFGVSAVYRF